MVDYKKSKHVNVLDFGADPTGTSDSATAIQNAINSVAAVPGGGSVEIPSGIYLVSNDFIILKDRVEVYGHGFSTQIIGFNKDPKNVRDIDGDNIGCQGVFHMGSYDTYTGDMGTNTPMRFGVRDMFIRGANLNLLNPNIRKGFFEHQIKKGKHIADNYIPDNIAGIIVHTRFDIFNEPEAAPIISNVEIWDTAIGIAILGEHDRAMKVDKVRIRKTRRQGLLVGKPVGHPQRQIESWNSGAADNKFVMVEVSDANLGGGYHGAIEVYGAQCKFVACTAWFAVRNKPDSDLYHTTNQYLRKSGAGWAVFGERNMFIGCTAQENGGHGWIVGFKDNQFMNCLGESSSYEDKITLRVQLRRIRRLIGTSAEMLPELVLLRRVLLILNPIGRRHVMDFIWRISWMILVLWLVHRVMLVMVINWIRMTVGTFSLSTIPVSPGVNSILILILWSIRPQQVMILVRRRKMT